MMAGSFSQRGRKFLIPEVIQTSAMDCGPATLSALLHGWRIRVNYGRLREACHADVDGTSMNTLEDLAKRLGLDAQQVMLPVDHFLDAIQALPAIVLMRTPSGTPHFVVYWRQHGHTVQIMDPVSGRHYVRASRFAEDLLVHSQALPTNELLEWLRSDSFQHPLSLQLRRLGMERAAVEALFDEARADDGWRRWAELDAAARMVKELVSSGGVRSGLEAAKLLAEIVKVGNAGADIPESYWSIRPAPSGLLAAGESEQLVLRGAVLLVIHGRLADEFQSSPERLPLSADLEMALSEPPDSPMRTLLELLPAKERGVIALVGLGGMAAATLQLGLDVLFRGMLHLAWYTRQPLLRLAAFAVAATFVLGVCGVVMILTYHALRLGRGLEIRLRAALFAKLPKLNDHYFNSRPVSDMAERAHSLLRVRMLPLLGIEGLRTACTVSLTTLALAYFLPQERLLTLSLMVVALAVPLALQSLLTRLDLRVRTYAGSMSRVYLDALVGLAPLRTHGGERALAHQHEELLTHWVRAHLQWLHYQASGQGLQLLLGYGLVALLVARYLGHGGDAAGLLLLSYWAFGASANGTTLSEQLLEYPDIRNVTLRLLEPLGVPSEALPSPIEKPSRDSAPMAITLSDVAVRLGGQDVLRDVSVDIPAGTHVAVVGTSGAGKSTLIGLLLGFHKAAAGKVQIDGQQVDEAALVEMRPQIAWVDPDVRLWNRSLFDNLHNGHSEGKADVLSQAVATADLNRVIAGLSSGLATPLGEGGRLLAGGEGQRVRLGRTLLQPAPRLVLLDEPFRGLDRGQRQELLDRVRRTWAQTTLVFVSHDIAYTLSFPRVLVLEDGKIVEAGEPAVLQARAESRYAALLKAERAVRHDLWAAAHWERVSMHDGQLIKMPEPAPDLEDA